MDKYIEYIRNNTGALNLADIAKSIGISASLLCSAVKGRKNANGYFYKVPEKCRENLKLYFERMNVVVPE